MKNIMTAGEDYIKKMELADVGLLKICLFSAGLFTGVCVPKGKKAKWGFWALLVYGITLVPLMSKFLTIWKQEK